MKRSLIVLSNTVFAPPDFRRTLIDEYTRMAKDTVFANNFEIANYKIVIDGEGIDKEQCVIFNKESYLTALGMDTILGQAYNVDSTSYALQLTMRKAMLLSYLKHFKVPVPDLFVGIKPPSTYSIKYGDGDSLGMSVSVNDQVKVFGDTAVVPWNMGYIEGYVIYFYLGMPIVMANIRFNNPSVILAKVIHPSKGYIRLNRTSKPTYANEKFEEVPCSNEEITSLDKIDILRFGDKGFTENILRVPYLLRSAACEVFIGKNLSGELQIIDVHHTHSPLCKLLYGERHFTSLICSNFLRFMGVDNDER
jgi:hypothetical protein